MDTTLTVRAGRDPRRVLLVCDAYPAYVDGTVAESARDKVLQWSAAGAEVLVLSGDPQPAGTMPVGYVETEEAWVDGVTVYRARFAPLLRRRDTAGHGAERALKLTVEGTLRQFRPDLLCVILGPVFGAIPLRKAAEHQLPVEIVDTLSLLRSSSQSHPRLRLRRQRRQTPDTGSSEGRHNPLARVLRRVERH